MGMSRDWELTRTIMLEIVDKTDYGGRPSKVVDQLAKEHGEAKVMLHVGWLRDDGLLEGDELAPTFGGPDYSEIIVRRVTASGQSFVELVSKSKGWEGFKKWLAELVQQGVAASIPAVLAWGLRQLQGGNG